MTDILEFRGPTRWLSNFHECLIVFEGWSYRSTEAAYQAHKTEMWEHRYPFVTMSPTLAMTTGRSRPVRPNWDEMKFDVMYSINLDKFTRHPELSQMLIATGDGRLIEGNTWGDIYWGVCDGIGQNNLGRILMLIRDRLQGK